MLQKILSTNKYLLFLLLLLMALWCGLLLSLPNTKAIIGDYAAFTFLGILGAIFANATGAGGGVVFIPAFEQLGFTGSQAIATSFGIQCMGMTSGAVAWSRLYRRQHRQRTDQVSGWRPFLPIIALVSPCSIAGLWTVYGAEIPPPGALGVMFGGFSVLLGTTILATSLWLQPGYVRDHLHGVDLVALILIGFFGGVITAWLSVGVGEIMAIYLILRRYSVTLAVATAVVVTALTVWAGIIEHTLHHPQVYWQVVLFAGPGAVFGAILARHLATRLPVIQLKRFFALWVLLMGLSSLAPHLI